MTNKIVICSAAPNSTVSMGKIVKYLANLWVENDNEVAILGLGYDPNLLDDNINKKIKIYPIVGSWGDENSIAHINTFLNDPNFMNGVTHIFGFGDAWYMNGINLPLQTNNIFYCNVDSDEFAERHWAIKLWDKLVFPLEFAEKSVLKTIPKLNQTEVIPHFVDEDIYKIKVNEELLKLKQSQDAPFILGYVGVNSGRKNLYTLLRVLSELKHLNIELWMVTKNNSPDGINIREVAAQLGISRKIKIIPRLSEEELVDFYNSIDVYVSSALSEAFGLPLIEAQACGVPVVVNNIAAHNEIAGYGSRLIKTSALIAPNTSGMVLKFPDLTSFKQSIIGMYNSRNKIRSLSFKEEVRKSISKYFWSNLKDKWLHVLDNVKQNTFIKEIVANHFRNFNYLFLSQRDLTFIEYRSLIKEIRNQNKNRKLIGIFKDGNLGDIIGTLPINEAIRKKYPDAVIGLIIQSSQLNNAGIKSMKEAFLDKFYDFILQIDSNFITWDVQLYDLFDILIKDRYLCQDITGTIQPTEFFERYKKYYNNYVLSNSHLGMIGYNVVELGLKSLGFDIKDIDLNKISSKFTEQEVSELKDKKFIFIDNKSNFSPSKLLNKSNYIDLLNKLLDKYPDYMIVHGNSITLNNPREFNRAFNIKELVWLIRNAKVVITVENAISWLSYILNVKNTIVLFSNTSDVVFNLGLNNLSEHKCQPCWWTSFNWTVSCYLGYPQCINISDTDKILQKVDELVNRL